MKTQDCLKLTSTSERMTMRIGARLGKRLTAGSVVALEGNLGSGKTTFAKGIVHGVQAKAHRNDVPVTSPSFALVHEYETTPPVYHIDCYRLDREREFDLIGIDDFLYGNGIALVEWAERIKALLPPTVITVQMTITKTTARAITIHIPRELGLGAFVPSLKR